MKGKQHYEAAEEILVHARGILNAQSELLQLKPSTPVGMASSITGQMLALAQVHATLALAQATLVVLESEDWEKP